ncbi:GntR family transcriptional regulator [Fusobacterium varium]|uniref:GntR family transcriptional regulator n=1 Tax=Fusobacterium varium TaxID=856 RepID=UPI00356ADCC9
MPKESKYKIIENSIIKDIKEQKFKSGDRIPTEVELCEKFNTSRMTVNKAIVSLVSKGYIKRVSGRGSFVTGQIIEKPLKRIPRSFSEDMRSIGLEPGAILLEYRILRASELPQNIFQKLNVQSNEFVHFFSRLRTGNGMNVAISYDYVPCSTLPVIEAARLEGSFFEYVKECGLNLGSTDLVITATLPTSEQREKLKIENEALLKVSHITRLDDGRILEYIDTFYVGSMYAYRAVY